MVVTIIRKSIKKRDSNFIYFIAFYSYMLKEISVGNCIQNSDNLLMRISIYMNVYNTLQCSKFLESIMEEKSEKSTNIEHMNDILSNDELSNHPTQENKLKQLKRKYKRKRKRKLKLKPKKKISRKCSECNKLRIPSGGNNQICYICYNAKKKNHTKWK
ncbi:hypothetical protein RhiirC2_781010 [Rhizophagus irregularis]|uniref:Uncharacterized protein n=1 Tax=Rhizophagus irregularis TaxID=588596 RepID=A0A2N1N6E6_9GLOM|nr:hypothetical protein RhiirC2_781010 [Rhizophagus irregularis]